jgi:spoIIIJ-associated protein
MEITKKEQEIIHKEITSLLEKIGVAANPSVNVFEDRIDVMLETDESGILIGYHGEGLEALQLIYSLIIAKKLGRFIRVTLDIGDYRKNRSEYLEKLAAQTKEKVLYENREQVLSALKPWERRVVHMILQNDEEVVSESTGEGKDRVLVVKPRAK